VRWVGCNEGPVELRPRSGLLRGLGDLGLGFVNS
jgi:hypothetical protein